MRPAWLRDGQWECSYCGRRLRITPGPDGRVLFAPGWVQESGRVVFRKPHHSGTAVSVLRPDGQRVSLGREAGGPGRTYPTPATVVCWNKDCGESVEVG